MMSEWQPIDTAPKDSTAILVRRVYEGRVVKEGLAFFGEVYPSSDYVGPSPRWVNLDGYRAFPEPTHWLPDEEDLPES